MDKAHKQTDKILNNLEKELEGVYKDAYISISEKMENLLKKIDLKEGENNYSKVAKLKRFKQLQLQIAKEIAKINKQSVEEIVKMLDETVKINYDYAKELITDQVEDLRWTMLNPKTYEAVLKEQDNPLFYLSVDNLEERQRIYSKIKQELAVGLVQGESTYKIAKRLEKLLGVNYNSAIRIARTEITRAENISRLKAFKYAESLGIKQMKSWIATGDKRTRESHQNVNGELVPLDKPFSNGLMYPGDPMGSANEIVNCRCAMTTEIIGV